MSITYTSFHYLSITPQLIYLHEVLIKYVTLNFPPTEIKINLSRKLLNLPEHELFILCLKFEGLTTVVMKSSSGI
jgi:hypothetical protein